MLTLQSSTDLHVHVSGMDGEFQMMSKEQNL